MAQISVTSAKQSGNWADYYVNEVLLGTGVTAFNATFTGCDTTYFSHAEGMDSTQISEFTNAGSVVDLPDGLFMTSGSSEILAGYNPNPNAGPNGADGVSDPDLQALLPSFNVHNTAILEFDFVPQGDTIRFNYVFGSLEYPVYVCQSFNDVFGFFLSGPGISGPFTNGAENLAVVPGTATPVAINTINDTSNGNQCTPACPCNSQYFVNNYNAPVDTNVAFGGLTVSLEAVAEVICGDTYHIKMAIADAGDGVLDSGVFLEGGSFTSNLIEVNIQTVNGDSTINEGCGTADIAFTRGDTTDTSISYITYSGTAINGVDFDLLPDTIILLPGVQDTVITINPFSDGLAEGVEYVTISCLSITLCGDTFTSSGTMYIYDLPNLTIEKTADSTLDCPPDSFLLWAQALSGGPPPFSYVWSTTDTLDTIAPTDSVWVQLSPNGGVDTFVVALQDSCALTTIYDTVFVTKNYADDPVTTVTTDTLVDCSGDELILTCDVEFGTAPLSFQWSTGSTSDTTVITVNSDGFAVVSVTDACGRLVVDTSFFGIHTFDSIQVAFEDTTVYCIGAPIAIDPGFQGGLPPYQYAWQAQNPVFGDDSILHTTINGDTVIHLWVQDLCGRRFDTTFFIQAIEVDPLMATLPEREAICAGTNFLLDPEVSGGLAPLTYEWSTTETDTAIDFIATVSSLVTVSITDFCGTQVVAAADIFVPDVEDMSVDLGLDRQLCYGEKYVFEANTLGGAGKYTYEWIPGSVASAGEQFQRLDSNVFQVVVEQGNTHLIRVSDQCGNTVEDSLVLEVEHCLQVPNVLTPNGDGMNDAFYINNITQFADPHLFIYNRWGQKIFESKPYRNEWVPLQHPSGTYYYVLRSANFPEMRGDLTIINDIVKR